MISLPKKVIRGLTRQKNESSIEFTNCNSQYDYCKQNLNCQKASLTHLF